MTTSYNISARFPASQHQIKENSWTLVFCSSYITSSYQFHRPVGNWVSCLAPEHRKNFKSQAFQNLAQQTQPWTPVRFIDSSVHTNSVHWKHLRKVPDHASGTRSYEGSTGRSIRTEKQVSVGWHQRSALLLKSTDRSCDRSWQFQFCHCGQRLEFCVVTIGFWRLKMARTKVSFWPLPHVSPNL